MIHQQQLCPDQCHQISSNSTITNFTIDYILFQKQTLPDEQQTTTLNNTFFHIVQDKTQTFMNYYLEQGNITKTDCAQQTVKICQNDAQTQTNVILTTGTTTNE
ncbi:unnamed protein product [Rotaria sordida]|uniref:Uncharacterized protein n=1 Tax=Rotaria sordida TaxID=392033 RepID=A0A814G0E5_9BILA|nr:unnamed protein product [Rotaria sordida]CAF0988288.1 unnamed protein product [Rotaria sordida]CAF0988927.1 unnamed protein product [Rotaria sordida]